MRTLSGQHLILALFCVSWCWIICFGKLHRCGQKNKSYSQNGTSIAVNLGNPVSISFCIKSDTYVYTYISINHPNHATKWHPNPDAADQNHFDVTVEPKTINTNVTITIKRVEPEDLSGWFLVTALSADKDDKPGDDKLFFWFDLEPAGNVSLEQSGQGDESEPNLLYLYIVLPIVFVVVAAVIGGVINRRRGVCTQRSSTTNVQCLAKSRESGESGNDGNARYVYPEEKTRVDTINICVSSENVYNQDPGHFISDEGLTYITVTSLPPQAQANPTKAKVQQEDNVEYTTLDFHKSGKLAG